jgi:hypothetical protein
MTSKQVKEAYKSASKGPRMSRAERIQMERAEQQRIRKEMEKEKSAAKARLLRDKKKEKELAEREVKRREGRPLVNVRPSQDTIARFMRGNGSGRKRGCVESVANHSRPCPAKLGPAVSSTGNISATKDTLKAIDEGGDKDGHQDNSQNPKDAAHAKDHPTVIHGLHSTHFDSTRRDVRTHLVDGCQSITSQLPDGLPSENTRRALGDETLAAILDGDLDTDLSQNTLPRPLAGLSCQARGQLPQNEMEYLDALLGEDFDYDVLDVLDGLKDSRGDRARTLCPNDRSMVHAEESACSAPGTPSTKEDVRLGTSEGQQPSLAVEQGPLDIRKPLGAPDSERLPSSRALQVPALSTQAIILNLDDFFPSASQQARELDQESADFDSLLESLTPSQAMPPPPAPASAARAASQRSLITPKAQAGLVQEPCPAEQAVPYTKPTSSPMAGPQQWFTASGSKELESLILQRSRRTAALEELQEKERRRARGGLGTVETGATSSPPVALQQSATLVLPEPPSKRVCSSSPMGKENVPPGASQETEYDGGWVEDFEFC